METALNRTHPGTAPTLPIGVYLRPRIRLMPFLLLEPCCRVYSLGRHALFSAVRALGLVEGDEIVVPAYHHGSEVEALLHAGLRCRFFDFDDDLASREAELEELLGPRTGGSF